MLSTAQISQIRMFMLTTQLEVFFANFSFLMLFLSTFFYWIDVSGGSPYYSKLSNISRSWRSQPLLPIHRLSPKGKREGMGKRRQASLLDSKYRENIQKTNDSPHPFLAPPSSPLWGMQATPPPSSLGDGKGKQATPRLSFPYPSLACFPQRGWEERWVQSGEKRQRLQNLFALKSRENFFAGLTMFVANLCLILLLSLRWKQSGHFPLSNLYESLMFLSWSLTIFPILSFFKGYAFILPSKNITLISQFYNSSGETISPLCAPVPSSHPQRGGVARSALRSAPESSKRSAAPLGMEAIRSPAPPLSFSPLGISDKGISDKGISDKGMGKRGEPEAAKISSDSFGFLESNKNFKIEKLLGAITSPTALFTNAFATFSLPKEMQESSSLVPALQSNWLMMHVTVMIFSYAALILGSLLSIAFLILNSRFMSKKKWLGLSFKNNFIHPVSPPFGSSHIFFPIPEGEASDPFFPVREGKDKRLFIWRAEEEPSPLSAKRPSLSCVSPSSFPSPLPLSPSEIGASGYASPSGSLASPPPCGERMGKNRDASNFNKLSLILDNLSYRILGIGFPFLTIGILSGAVWANEAWGSYWSWDPKETWAFLTWLVFAIYLHTRLTKGWQGQKPAIIASFGFVTVWVCYLGVNLIGEGLHSYGWVLHS